jgi:hypothetical protein
MLRGTVVNLKSIVKCFSHKVLVANIIHKPRRERSEESNWTSPKVGRNSTFCAAHVIIVLCLSMHTHGPRRKGGTKLPLTQKWMFLTNFLLPTCVRYLDE